MNTQIHEPPVCDLEALNSLLRGEMSAVECYTLSLGKFNDLQLIADLQTIRDDHSRAVRQLRDQVVWFGGKPAECAGAWGIFAETLTSVAKVIGPTTALDALREGEEHGIDEYENALENNDIHPDCHRLIRYELLPACRKHIEELDRLKSEQNR